MESKTWSYKDMPLLWHILDKVVIIVGIGSLFVPYFLMFFHVINQSTAMTLLVLGFVGALAVRSILFAWLDEEYDKWREANKG